MILKEVSLKNFKSHKNSKITFEKGINLIAGRNGAGKSSILEAILVALYGVRPGYARKADLIQIGAVDYSVEINFEISNKEYRIKRSSGGNSELRGDVIIEGDQRINEWVEKNLLPFHIFTGAVYVRQGEIETIISDESGREKIIRKITRIEDYENAWKNLGVVLKELENELKRHMEIVKQKDDCERRLKEKKLEIARVQEEIEACKRKLQALKELILKVSSEKKNLDELKEKIERVSFEFLALESETKGLKERLSVMEKQKLEIEQRISSLLETVKKLETVEKEASKYLELSEFHKNFLRTMQELESKLNNLEIEKERILMEIKRNEEEKENLEKIGEEIKEIENRLKILAIEVEKWQKIRQKVERKAQIDRILSEKGMSIEKVEKAFSTIQKARELDKMVSEEFEKLSSQKGFLISEEKRLSEVIEKLKFATGICPLCSRELSEEHRKELLNKYRSDLANIKEKLSKLDEREKKLKEDRKRIEEVLQKQDTVLKFKQLVEELKKIDEYLKDVDVEQLKNQNDEFEKLKNRVEFLRGIEAKLPDIAKKLSLLREKLENFKIKHLEVLKDKEKLMNQLKEKNIESIKELENEIERLKASYEEWIRIKEAREELVLAESKLKILKEDLRKISEDLKSKMEQLDVKKNLLKELEKGYDKKHHLELESAEKDISKDVAGLEERIDVLLRSIESLKADRDYLEKQLEIIKESERRANAIEKAIPELNRIREKFASYKNILAEVALKEVEKYASEIFEEFTEGKYSGIKLKRVFEYGKEKLKIFVVYQGGEYETSFLSGGELVVLGIAFRLALSMFEARGRIPLLIMDEPTPFLDEDRRKKLVEITLNYLRRIPQVIIVSHDEELKDAADKVILVENRGGVSFVASQ